MFSHSSLIYLTKYEKWLPLADKIFVCIFMKEKFCFEIPTSLKIVHKGPVDIMSVFVYVFIGATR